MGLDYSHSDCLAADRKGFRNAVFEHVTSSPQSRVKVTAAPSGSPVRVDEPVALSMAARLLKAAPLM
jgi:hypothetical protein